MPVPTIRRYVALGDSLSEGYSDWGRGDRSTGFASLLAGLLRANSPQLEFTNLGVSGARVVDVLRNQTGRAIALAPDLVTLVVGSNDVPATPPAQFRRDYFDLAGRLRAGASGILLIANLPNVIHLLPAHYASFRPVIVARLAELNQIIADAAAAHAALLVDLHSSSEVEDPRNLSADGLHPNARGYRAMARIFVQTLNHAGLDLPEPTLDP